MPQVSAIIPSYNSYRTIMRTIDSLLMQPTAFLKEIIIVDSSDDGKTQATLAECRSSLIRVIHLDKKTIPAIGRNIGAQNAKSEILAFIDSDAYATPDWVTTILTAYEDGCRVGGGAILLPPYQREFPVPAAQYFLQFNEFMEEGKRRVVDFSPSCNLFCQKKVFERIGGFPEIRASEDVLFGLKASRDQAYFFDPNIQVFHIFSTDRERYYSNQRLLGAYILRYRRQYYRNWYLKGPVAALFLPFFLAVKFARISGRILKSKSGWKIKSYFKTLPVFLEGLSLWARGFFGECFSRQKDPL